MNESKDLARTIEQYGVFFRVIGLIGAAVFIIVGIGEMQMESPPMGAIFSSFAIAIAILVQCFWVANVSSALRILLLRESMTAGDAR